MWGVSYFLGSGGGRFGEVEWNWRGACVEVLKSWWRRGLDGERDGDHAMDA